MTSPTNLTEPRLRVNTNTDGEIDREATQRQTGNLEGRSVRECGSEESLCGLAVVAIVIVAVGIYKLATVCNWYWPGRC